MIPANAIVLLSGGLDSEVSMALARRRFGLLEALTFDYGQRAAMQEIRAARRFSARFSCPHRVLSLGFLTDALCSSLTTTQAIPELAESDLDTDKCRDTAKAVWVPNRNGLFLNIAATIAEQKRADWIVCGFNREEAATFPDNSQEFIDISNLFFHLSTANSVRVWSGTIQYDKTQIARVAHEEDIPLDSFWSCYHGGDRMCGRCESCVRAIRALKGAKLWDLHKGRFA